MKFIYSHLLELVWEFKANTVVWTKSLGQNIWTTLLDRVSEGRWISLFWNLFLKFKVTMYRESEREMRIDTFLVKLRERGGGEKDK